jgi:3-dehydroquinate synthase
VSAETVSVELGERSYPIVIGHEVLAEHSLLRRHIPGRHVLIVSDVTVWPLHGANLKHGLSGCRIVEALLPEGESSKTLENVSRVLDVLVANRFGRDCTLVALGGGVVGDLAGFAASCYQRGVAYVQVPTTLLAQVDSAVGGKTAVNHPGGKNLIGAFHQPRAVLTDTATLATLPARELRAGLAEVIKYGLIRDVAFFDWLEANIERLLRRDTEALAYAIRRSCEIKAQIVGRDEREQGERAILNLGHTFGHAIESATAYSGWLHGEAVGAGLLIAADMSVRCGTLAPAELERVRTLLARADLPLAAREIPASTALEHMRIDKKVKAGRLRLVLLRGLGEAYISAEYPDPTLLATVQAYFG